jgi:CubicO group peptidase (beta-lactamase class C family)
MKKRLLIFSIGYLAACCWSQARQNGVQPLSIAETVLLDPNEKNPDLPVDDYVKERMRELHIPGLSLAVVKEGRIIKASGYGLASLETNTPATPETVYKTASLSKPFIAAAVLLLMQEGRIGLDDHISKYLDASPETWKEITIRHLLTHTSGIVRDPSDYHPYNDQLTLNVFFCSPQPRSSAFPFDMIKVPSNKPVL